MPGPEAYVRALIGERRLALVRAGALVAMRIARDGDGLAAGSLVDARLKTRTGERGFAVARGQDLLVEPWPAGASEGATVVLEVTRGAWTEPGRERLAKARPARTASPRPAPGLEDAAAADGARLRTGWPAWLEQQWAEAFEAAELGSIGFAGSRLMLQPTPAFLAIDVDGASPDPIAACAAVARVIRLWDLSGSIVIDLPDAGRDSRQAAAAALDSALADMRFERTAINGFGLMQLVLPRRGPSVLERALLDRAGTAAIALMEAARREARPGSLRLVAAPAISRWIAARPHLLPDLARTTGRRVDVVADPVAGTGHVETSA